MTRYKPASVTLLWSFSTALLLFFTSAGKADKVGSKRSNSYATPAQRAMFDRRARQFGRLWLSRRQRKVTPQLLKMLAVEPTEQLREHIVIALGRIGDPQAVKPLQALLQSARRAQQHSSAFPARSAIPPFRLTLAIGRINARKLRGTARLNAVARSVGTNWPGIQRMAARLRAQLRAPRTLYAAQKSDEREIVEEFYDVLYRMGKGGENIQRLGANSLQLWSGPGLVETVNRFQEQGLLRTAAMSDSQEVKYWLSHALPPGVTGFDPAHLLDLGSTVPQELARALQTCLRRAKTNPQSMQGKSINAWKPLFDAAVATNDRRYVPLLRGFVKINDRWTKIFAIQAVQDLEQRRGTLLFP